jgi:hypothetical protein
LKIYAHVLRGYSLDKEIYFLSITFVSLSLIINFFFVKLVRNNEKKEKKKQTEENFLINKETNNHILIDSMGLAPQYEEKQKAKFKENQSTFLSFNLLISFSKIIPFIIVASFHFFCLILFEVETADNLLSFFPFNSIP